MEQYAGIDVSLDSASVCIVDAQGKILKEAKVVWEPQALIAWFAAHGTPIARIGLEAGPLSQGLFAGLKGAGLPGERVAAPDVRGSACARRAIGARRSRPCRSRPIGRTPAASPS